MGGHLKAWSAQWDPHTDFSKSHSPSLAWRASASIPLAVVWPSGWAWEPGAPYQSHLFMMIVGVYATLGVFLLHAARDPQANLSLI